MGTASLLASWNARRIFSAGARDASEVQNDRVATTCWPISARSFAAASVPSMRANARAGSSCAPWGVRNAPSTVRYGRIGPAPSMEGSGTTS